MKKEITYRKAQEIDTLATNYLILNGYFTPAIPAQNGEPAKPGAWTNKTPTKLVLNIKNIIKQLADHFKNFEELRSDIWLDNCVVDEKTKAVLYNEKGGYQFTKEGLKNVNKEVKELADKTIEVHVRITEGDWNLSDEEREAFNGILIPEFKKEEVEN